MDLPISFPIILSFLAAYLLGSISASILVSKLFGLPDPRAHGSGNPGATNVMRTGHKLAAVCTLLGDMMKGAIAVAIGWLLGLSSMWLAWLTLAVILGHLYPVFFGFKGGKGVATSLGAILVLCWPLGLMLLVTWLVAYGISKISAVGALTATALLPLYSLYWLHADQLLPMMVVTLLLWWRHRSNLRKILAGKT